MPDIRSWRDIDAPWLSEVLCQAGFDAEVAHFEAGKVGTGQIGDCVRFTLHYARAGDRVPASLVGKFPAEGEESRAAGISLGNYYREVKFYQILQPRARLATPHCYFTDVDEETHDFVLIMSDLAPARQGDQLAGVTLAEARLVLTEAAKLHAAFWQDESLDQYPWVGGTTNAPNPVQPELVAALWKGFKDRYGTRVTGQARQIGDAMTANLDRNETLRSGSRTLIHSDFRPDNMLFSQATGQAPVTVVDWQSFGYGPGAADVGYFIAGALSPELRRDKERYLLEHYVAEFERQGAGPYPEDELYRHYVLGAYQHFLTAFFAAMLVTQTNRGDDMFFRMLNGAVDVIVDHNAADWFA